MRLGTRCAALVAVSLWLGVLGAQSAPWRAHPDLQGFWNSGTMTPLQRPAAFADRAAFTPEEAADFERTFFERVRQQLGPEFALQQSDFNETYIEGVRLDGLRTSLIVDPSNGMLPPLLPVAKARVAGRPARSYDDPEGANLSERCLLGNVLFGSSASPPIVPNPVVSSYYQIVQTDDVVMIFTEWMHDARIIRMGGTHVSSAVKKWLGDSVGRWEGETLVVDTTNFRVETHNQESSERLHVVERFTRPDPETIRYHVTGDDPDTWAMSWTAEMPFKATNNKIYEFACHESNYAIENFLRGARAEEKRRSAPAVR